MKALNKNFLIILIIIVLTITNIITLSLFLKEINISDDSFNEDDIEYDLPYLDGKILEVKKDYIIAEINYIDLMTYHYKYSDAIIESYDNWHKVKINYKKYSFEFSDYIQSSDKSHPEKHKLLAGYNFSIDFKPDQVSLKNNQPIFNISEIIIPDNLNAVCKLY